MCSNIPVKEKLSMLQQLSGILRAEIRFSDLKSIQPVPDTTATQIHQMIAIHQELFFDVFARIIPYGNFYKKMKLQKSSAATSATMRLEEKCFLS